jgi:hypothetical protein
LRYPITSPDQTSVGVCVCVSWFSPPLPLVNDCIIWYHLCASLTGVACNPLPANNLSAIIAPPVG